MTPLQTAILLNGDGEFWSDVAEIVQGGGVFLVTADTVLLARNDGDSWYVHSAVGRVDVIAALAKLHPKKRVAFHKRGRAFEHQLEKILSRWQKNQITRPS